MSSSCDTRGEEEEEAVDSIDVSFSDVIKGGHGIAIFLGFLVLGARGSVKKAEKNRERMDFFDVGVWREEEEEKER